MSRNSWLIDRADEATARHRYRTGLVGTNTRVTAGVYTWSLRDASGVEIDSGTARSRYTASDECDAAARARYPEATRSWDARRVTA